MKLRWCIRDEEYETGFMELVEYVGHGIHRMKPVMDTRTVTVLQMQDGDGWADVPFVDVRDR